MNRCTPLTLTLGLGQYSAKSSQKQFHKSHHFDIHENIPLLTEARRPGIGGRPIFDIKNEPSLYPKSRGSLLPGWLVYEQKVLRFFGYFKETLPEQRTPYQVRHVKIVFYLEDGTIQVTEPNTTSEVPQGCLVARQRIRKSAPYEREDVSLLDLNVAQCITLLDRVYYITDCDKFTRHFLNRLGVCVPSAQESPKDPSTELRRIQYESQRVAKHPTSKDFRFARFLVNDRNVLRFTGYWDDTNTANGDIRHLELLYHLADDTVEIKEKLPRNSGRVSNGMFLKRTKLPRKACKIKDVGEGNFCVLNVLGKDAMKGRFLKDRLDVDYGGDDSSVYYKENDLAIGRRINVYGRDVILTDCDGKTREFYRKKYGIEEFDAIKMPTSYIQPVHKAMFERQLPVYNGWGSYVDSEQNCNSHVEVKPAKIDFMKFMIYDKIALRFGAKMISKYPENNERLFIIFYYMSDDTISIYELERRNCGFMGGEFFGKSQFYLPGQDKFARERPKIYKAQDFYLSSIVVLRSFVFEIVSADIFALEFMEQHKDEFPLSNINIITNKIRCSLMPIYKDFISCYMTKVKTIITGDQSCEFICYEDFKDLLKALLKENIVEQEIVTLCRYFAVTSKDSPSTHRDLVRSIIQEFIQRELWDDLERLKEFLYHLSPDKQDYLTEKQLLTTIRGCRIPLDITIVQQLFSVLNRNQKGEIEVRDFLNFLNIKNCKSSPLPPINPKKNQFNFVSFDGNLIDWKLFIKIIDLEDDLEKSGS